MFVTPTYTSNYLPTTVDAILYASICRSMPAPLTAWLPCSMPAWWAVCHAQMSSWKMEQNPRPECSNLHRSTKQPAKVYCHQIFWIYQVECIYQYCECLSMGILYMLQGPQLYTVPYMNGKENTFTKMFSMNSMFDLILNMILSSGTTSFTSLMVWHDNTTNL